MSYLDEVATEIRHIAEPEADRRQEELPLYRLYAVLMLAKGQEVTLEDVHNAWVAWASEYEPNSRHIIPFKELSLSVQRKDQNYVNAIHEVAARLGLSESRVDTAR